jgi:hypothetical protein
MEVFFTARARPAAPEAFDVRIYFIHLTNYFYVYFFSLIHDFVDPFFKNLFQRRYGEH